MNMLSTQEDNPVKADAVIIDEISVVDILLFHMLKAIARVPAYYGERC